MKLSLKCQVHLMASTLVAEFLDQSLGITHYIVLITYLQVADVCVVS